MNFIRSIRSIGLYLFIDFRKAFDLINTTLLLYKLELYGFDTNAINLRTLKCKLFADDTTISSISSNPDDLLINFNTSINSLTEWCSFNTMDINWDKTLAMFITNKHITTPNSIMIGNIEVKVVSEFTGYHNR